MRSVTNWKISKHSSTSAATYIADIYSELFLFQQAPALAINKEVFSNILPSFPNKPAVDPAPVFSAVLTGQWFPYLHPLRFVPYYKKLFVTTEYFNFQWVMFCEMCYVYLFIYSPYQACLHSAR